MINETDFAALVSAARSGDPAAVEAIVSKFGPSIQLTVRKHLPNKLRTMFDSLDFTQDVWASFYRSNPTTQRFETPEQLAAFLAKIARFKLTDMVRHRLHTLKYNKEREQPVGLHNNLDDVIIKSSAGTASELAIADETYNAILNRLPAAHREILLRLREGYLREEIAEMSGVSIRTVDRVISRLKEITEAPDQL